MLQDVVELAGFGKSSSVEFADRETQTIAPVL
jgi:hypothetical protein